MSYIGIDKWAKAIKIIVDNGGLFKSFYKLWRHDTLKEGKLVGCDSFGNKYYENNYYMLGRNRWVEYNMQVRWDYDASQVTPEWYGWLHNRTDKLPSEDCAKLEISNCAWCQCWLLPHEENRSGSNKAYYPFSTTKAHIYVWDGLFLGARPCHTLPPSKDNIN